MWKAFCRWFGKRFAKPSKPDTPRPLSMLPEWGDIDDGRRYRLDCVEWGHPTTRSAVTVQQANALIGLHNENIKRGQLWRLEITRIK